LVILACTVLTDPPVWRTDGRTDRQMELRWHMLTMTLRVNGAR